MNGHFLRSQRWLRLFQLYSLLAVTQSVDYYRLLGVSRRASPQEIKKAYRQKSLEHHPDKNKDENAAGVFAEINRAYEVLADDELKNIYDRSGAQGVTDFEQRNRNNNHGVDEDYFYSEQPRPKTETVSFPLSVTLEQMYSGDSFDIQYNRQTLCVDWEMCIKRDNSCHSNGMRMRIQRFGPSFQQQIKSRDDRCIAPGKRWVDQCSHCSSMTSKKGKMLKIEIPPGARKGQRLTFAGMADERAEHDTGDLVFILEQQPHEVFRRDHDDLHLTVQVPLVDALTNFSTTLNTVDGQPFNIHKDGVIDTGDVLKVPGMGMPNRSRPRQKGDLHVKFDVVFPEELSLRQKEMIRQAFFLEEVSEASNEVGAEL
jgi:DnaJ-class molecular chaperone